GCGTSGRSSKLVHGGLRYLAYGDFRMVREAARERQVLREIAPHLVHPLQFLMPVWQGQSLAKYQLGLWLFDRLSAATGDERHQNLNVAEMAERLPGLRTGLRGGLAYGEYVTDDARLTLANALSAAEHGAQLANHAPAVSIDQEGGRVVGATVRDGLTGETYRARAKVTVNATGPWAAQTLGLSGKPAPKALMPSRGIHLLFRADRLPIPGAAALNAPSGRAGFAIRRWDYVYVGTTDDAYDGPLETPTADAQAAASLLSLTRECFPGLELTPEDIVGTWAGLRPLIAEPGKSPRDTSRHDEVWAGPDGLFTVAGGKLTTYRPMSRRVMRHVEQALGLSSGDGRRSAEEPLPGAAAPDRTKLRHLPEKTAERLAWLYGAHTDRLLAMGDEDPAWLAPLAPGVPALCGEVRLAVEQEMALTLSDFLDRRSSLLLFTPDHGRAAAAATAAIMGPLLDWSEAEAERQVAEYGRVALAHQNPMA
ncbi:MAG TPA: glycerol-3-phosphate dehydrogenase/oxidase, partial [Symbiobacteriaceae bacterium]|nr:glycerol-3-phosphate dehydrogenase/oxidase [Symbiobacteriaceae bacterium]